MIINKPEQLCKRFINTKLNNINKLRLTYLFTGLLTSSLTWFSLTFFNSAQAQITPDNTLGTESSVITPNQIIKGISSDQINGGATRGVNLFHSFTQFNIGAGQAAYFTNPTGIQNILTRVTGSNASNIFGTLGVLGNANLFLMNPNGIIFGQNAHLDLGGSFLATTAHNILFENGLKFSTTNPQAPPLLTITAPIGLGLGNNPANIANNSFNLQVNPGNTLALVGGNITLDGGTLQTSGGRIELGGLTGEGIVNLNIQTSEGLQKLTSLTFPDHVERADVYLSNQSVVNVLGENNGSIAINARNVNIVGGSKLQAGIATGQGTPENQAGDIKINATDKVVVDGISGEGNPSGAFNLVEAEAIGNSGDIKINAKTLEVTNGGQLNTSTYGTGNAGKISIITTDKVVFDGQSLWGCDNGCISSAFSMVGKNAVGNSGGIEIKAGSVDITNGGQLSASTLARGNAGKIQITANDKVQFNGMSAYGFLSSAFSQVQNGAEGNSGGIEIKAGSVEVTNGGQLSATTLAKGDAGKIQITANDKVLFDGQSLYGNISAVFSQVQKGAIGNSGGIEIKAGSVEVTNGGQLSAATLAQGNAGKIQITVRDQVLIDGESPSASLSFLTSQVLDGAVGNSGGIEINAENVKVSNGAQLTANTLGTGNAGKIKITARDQILFDGESKDAFLSSALSQVEKGAVGNSGGFELSGANVALTNGAQISATTLGKGDAGKIKITATNKVVFDGKSKLSGSRSSAFSQVFGGSEGNSGGIEINAGIFELTNSGLLDASTLGTGNAGAITITANDRATLDNNTYAASQVTSSAKGNAGGISVTTKSLEILNNSFLSATTFGEGDAGNIIINAPQLVNLANNSSLTVETSSSGKSGDITITTDNLKLIEASLISATAANTATGEQGGNIIVNTSHLNLANTSSILAKTQGIVAAGTITLQPDINKSILNITLADNSIISASTSDTGKGGELQITAPEAININGLGKLTVETENKGDAGNININTHNFNIQNTEISASTTGGGKAGGVTLNADFINIINGAKIFAFTSSEGNSGNIIINSDKAVNLGIGVQNSSPILSVESSGAGKAGDIFINTPILTLSDTARITATVTKTATNTEGGGSITLNASKMNLAGVVGIFAETQGQAPAGTLQLNPYQNQSDLDITLFPNSTISASTTASGKGGDLIIKSPENINITGQGKLAVESGGTGNAGNIEIITKNLNITDGVKISASTINSGQGGSINLKSNTFTATKGAQFLSTTAGNAQAGNINLEVKDHITLDGTNTGLFANTEKGSTGKSGNINIDPEIFIIRNGAGIGVNSLGSRQGGDISIEAGTLILDNNAFINAATASSQGGEITLQIKDLLFMRHNSNITATAGTDKAGGNGGNININAPFIVAVSNENNNITANAYQGNGGNININTNQIFGLQYRPQETLLSDITASSEFGVSGNVEITTPGVDPTSGLTNLPTSLVDAESLKKDVCAIKDDKIAGGSSFIIAGKGGLPADTHELISNSPAFVEWENNSDVITQANLSPVKVIQKNINYHQQIQQAQGWIITSDGKILLTADTQKITLQTDKNNLPNCK